MRQAVHCWVPALPLSRHGDRSSRCGRPAGHGQIITRWPSCAHHRCQRRHRAGRGGAGSGDHVGGRQAITIGVGLRRPEAPVSSSRLSPKRWTALGAWYRDYLGLDADENGRWRPETGPTGSGRGRRNAGHGRVGRFGWSPILKATGSSCGSPPESRPTSAYREPPAREHLRARPCAMKEGSGMANLHHHQPNPWCGDAAVTFTRAAFSNRLPLHPMIWKDSSRHRQSKLMFGAGRPLALQVNTVN